MPPAARRIGDQCDTSAPACSGVYEAPRRGGEQLPALPGGCPRRASAGWLAPGGLVPGRWPWAAWCRVAGPGGLVPGGCLPGGPGAGRLAPGAPVSADLGRAAILDSFVIQIPLTFGYRWYLMW